MNLSLKSGTIEMDSFSMYGSFIWIVYASELRLQISPIKIILCKL